MENALAFSPQGSPISSPSGTTDENTSMRKMKSWGRMISIRAQSAGHAVQSASQSASQPLSNEQELAEFEASGSSEPMRTDSAVVNSPQTPSAGSQGIQNGPQSSENQRVFVRIRSCRSVQVSDQEKGAARSKRDGAPTNSSPDRHACSCNIIQQFQFSWDSLVKPFTSEVNGLCMNIAHFFQTR